MVKNEQLSHNFLRHMTKSNAKNVTKLHEHQHGVKGMAGCLDHIHVQLENCLYSLHGQYVGKDGVPMLVIEARCSYNLFFGIMNLDMQEC